MSETWSDLADAGHDPDPLFWHSQMATALADPVCSSPMSFVFPEGCNGQLGCSDESLSQHSTRRSSGEEFVPPSTYADGFAASVCPPNDPKLWGSAGLRNYHHMPAPPPPNPPPLARAAPKLNTDQAARRQAKSEYLRAYRSDQKSRAHQVGMELSQARVALEVMQDLHAELEAEHAACISRMAPGRRQSEWEPESDRTMSEAKRLSTEARRLAKQLQAQRRRAELFGGMIERLLDVGTVGVGVVPHRSPSNRNDVLRNNRALTPL
jgi:hypothetical protein